MVEIRTQTKNGAVENQYYLLGRAADNTPVIRRVRRELSEFLNQEQDGATLEPEVGIYRLTSPVNSVTLAAKQGLFQVYNDRDTDITVNATTFADNSTTFTLGSGKLLQSHCSMAVAQDNSVSYSYTTLVITFGRGTTAQQTQTPPNDDQYTTTIPDTNSVAPGRYKLVDDQTVTLQPFTDGEILPKEWWFWVDDPKADAVARSLFGDISTTIPAKIIGATTTFWTTDGATQTLVNKDEVIKVTLKAAQQADVDAARTALSNNTLTFDKLYEIERVWTKPSATTTIPTPAKKNNLDATREPNVNDGSNQGYEKDSTWIYGDRVWVNTESAAGIANWEEVTLTESSDISQRIPFLPPIQTSEEALPVNVKANNLSNYINFDLRAAATNSTPVDGKYATELATEHIIKEIDELIVFPNLSKFAITNILNVLRLTLEEVTPLTGTSQDIIDAQARLDAAKAAALARLDVLQPWADLGLTRAQLDVILKNSGVSAGSNNLLDIIPELPDGSTLDKVAYEQKVVDAIAFINQSLATDALRDAEMAAVYKNIQDKIDELVGDEEVSKPIAVDAIKRIQTALQGLVLPTETAILDKFNQIVTPLNKSINYYTNAVKRGFTRADTVIALRDINEAISTNKTGIDTNKNNLEAYKSHTHDLSDLTQQIEDLEVLANSIRPARNLRWLREKDLFVGTGELGGNSLSFARGDKVFHDWRIVKSRIENQSSTLHLPDSDNRPNSGNLLGIWNDGTEDINILKPVIGDFFDAINGDNVVDNHYLIKPGEYWIFENRGFEGWFSTKNDLDLAPPHTHDYETSFNNRIVDLERITASDRWLREKDFSTDEFNPNDLILGVGDRNYHDWRINKSRYDQTKTLRLPPSSQRLSATGVDALGIWNDGAEDLNISFSPPDSIAGDNVVGNSYVIKAGEYWRFSLDENLIGRWNSRKTSSRILTDHTHEATVGSGITQSQLDAAVKIIADDLAAYKNHVHESRDIKWYRNDDLQIIDVASDLVSFANTDFPSTNSDVDDHPAYWDIIPENLPTNTKVIYFTYAKEQNPVYVYNSSKTNTNLYIAESGETGEELKNADGNTDFGIYNDYFIVPPKEFIKFAYATQTDILWEKFSNQTLPLSLELLDQRTKELQTDTTNLQNKDTDLETKDSDFEARIKFIEERISAFVRETQLTFADGVAYLRFTGMKDCTNWKIDNVTSITGVLLRLPRISEGYTDIGVFNNSGTAITIDHKESDGRILTQYFTTGAITFPEFHRINHGEMWKYKSNGARWVLTRHDTTHAFRLYNEILSMN